MITNYQAARFFDYARARHSVYLARQSGDPPPWTLDPILQSHRFTNVFRELDKTTVWFRRHVRDPMCREPEVLMATVVFRWFNRITTGEAIFCQTELAPPPECDAPTAWEQYLRTGDTKQLRRAIVACCGGGPYVTGAYTINTRSAGVGLSKLDGVLVLIDRFNKRQVKGQSWPEVAKWMLRVNRQGLTGIEATCQWLQTDMPCMGPFMAYEVATDLRHTNLLNRAPDIMTWANPGPGAQRGLRRLGGEEDIHDLQRPVRSDMAVGLMQWLLRMSQQDKFWPSQWPAWEMREVEHTLCEFDKYERVRLGQGAPRGKFGGS